MAYLKYDKSELLDKISKISITREGDLIVTKYGSRVLKTAVVSNRYEIFDIAKYLTEKLDAIEENFKISKYNFILSGGTQYLQLLSDSIDIGGHIYYKSFYILNSSDKSRMLSFNSGLYCENSNLYIISKVNAGGICKKHLRGVTQAAEDASSSITGETFNEQIEAISSLFGHRILFSKIRETIVDSDTQIAHKRFDAFKNSIKWSVKGLTSTQRRILSTPSENIKSIERDSDFYIDAIETLHMYLKIFNKQDSHIIKNETERIMKITQWAVRNAALEELGI
jgi:hypothetical protein